MVLSSVAQIDSLTLNEFMTHLRKYIVSIKQSIKTKPEPQ